MDETAVRCRAAWRSRRRLFGALAVCRVRWQLELTRCVPAGPVEGEHSMGTGRDTAADRLQVMLHGIGARKHECGAGVARGADRAEHIGVGVTPILGLARPRPLLCPQ
jgi:hypothetical protein